MITRENYVEATSTKPMRRTKLLAVPPLTVEPRKPKVLLYGPPGVGKTTFAISMPACYVIDTEGGADLKAYQDRLRASGGMYMGPDQGSTDFETVIGQVEALATERHQFRTLVIDSGTKLFNTAIVAEQERLGDKDAFGASKKGPVRQMNRLVRWLNRADMNAVIIAHEKDVWGLNDKGQREVVAKGPDIYEKLEYDLHLCIRAARIGGGANARRYGYIGKSRLPSFPEGDRFELTYEAFAERWGKDVIEAEVAPVVLASPDQVGELKRLLEIVKLPDGVTDKWLTRAGAESFEEMTGEQIAACIKLVKEKIAS